MEKINKISRPRRILSKLCKILSIISILQQHTHHLNISSQSYLPLLYRRQENHLSKLENQSLIGQIFSKNTSPWTKFMSKSNVKLIEIWNPVIVALSISVNYYPPAYTHTSNTQTSTSSKLCTSCTAHLSKLVSYRVEIWENTKAAYKRCADCRDELWG